MSIDIERLIDEATQVRENAHAPYSGYRVGAALLDENGDIHCGCNVENAAFPEGTCAEANAIGTMVAAGATRIRAIVAVGGRDKIDDCTPCGGCRQSILEFSDDDTVVIIVGKNESVRQYSIDELLPESFRLK